VSSLVKSSFSNYLDLTTRLLSFKPIEKWLPSGDKSNDTISDGSFIL